MRYRCLLIACLLWLPGAASAACSIGRVAELPVTMHGPEPMVPAKINGMDAMFIADSGAFFSLMSPASAAAFKLETEPTRGWLTGVGGSASLSVATVRRFSLAGIDLPHVQFAVGGSDFGVAGVLGQNILGFADVEYDLAGGVIRLFRPHGCEHAIMAYWAIGKPYSMLPIEPASITNRHTVGDVTLNGVKMRAMFDTGASRSILTLSAAARIGIKPGDPGVVEQKDSQWGIGRHVGRIWSARIASFKIGDNEEIRNVDLHIGELDFGSAADMLIGADFFLSHRVYVANGQHKLYFTYNGGPAFGITPHSEAAQQSAAAPSAPGDGRAPPADADGFARRGAAYAAQDDYARAIADLSRAIAMAPAEPRYLHQRALVYLASKQVPLGRADLDAELKLKPDDAQARLLRARLLLADAHPQEALADLDAAASAMPAQAEQRLELAELYGRADKFQQSIAQYDLWISSHSEDSRRPEAWNGRCWARALWGRELDKALADCTRAIHMRPRAAQIFDSRGLVHLRLGDPDKAIADYDAALALDPHIAWSLYGRSLARRRKGDTAAAQTDLAAALAIRPDLPEEARRYGIVPH